MSNLGVRIKVDYSDVTKLKNELKEKIKVQIDTDNALGKINELHRKLKTIRDHDEISLSFDTSKAVSELEAFERKLKDISDILGKNGSLGESLANNLEDNLTSKLKGIGTQIASALKDSFKNLDEDIVDDNIANKIVQAAAKAKAKVDQTVSKKDNDERSRLIKQIADLKKEANNARMKRMDYSKGDAEYDILTSRLHSRNGMLGAVIREYNSMFKGDYRNDATIKQLQSTLDYNLAMKEAGKKRQEQAAYDKETADSLKDYISLLNEQHSIAKKLAKEDQGTKVAETYRDQIKYLDDVISKKEKLYKLDKRLSGDQQSSLNSLVADHKAELEYIEKLSSAQSFDKQGKENLKQLKDELKQIYNLREKMSELTAKENAGVMNGKEESKLKQYQAELKALEEIHSQNKQNLALTEKQSQATQEYENKRKQALDSKASLAKERAELQKIDEAYNEIASSIRKVNDYYKMMENAGDNEAAALRRLIQLEEERQAEIRETNNLKENGNKIREEELATMKRLNAEQAEQADVIRKARGQDRFEERVKAHRWADLINPREVYQETKQAVLYMYNSVKEVEDQMVNIKKVLDPQDMNGFKTFREEIYDTASSVGKSAADYAVSVERWATAGKSLKEAQELGRISTIGSFVGNVDEAAMVDYMSVPLIAFKKHGLEATDVINSMNEVANNNAIEMDDLGAAYKRSAGTAAQVGTSFEELTGLITGAQETTRMGGERVGTALKAFDVNLGKISARLSKSDQTKFDFFKNIGVSLTDAEGKVKSTYKILEELQSKWSSLSQDDKNAAGFYIAGKHHQNILTSLINGWNTVKKARDEALGQQGLGEAGSAYREFAVQQDSLEFKQAELKNSWDKFIYTVSGGKDVFVQGMNAMTNALKVLTAMAKNPAIRTLAKTIGTIFATMAGNVALGKMFDLIGRGASATVNPLMNMTRLLKGVGTATNEANGSSGGFFGSMVSGAAKLGKALGAVGVALQVTDIGLRLLTGKGLIERSVQMFNDFYKSLHPVQGRLDDFTKSYGRYIERITKADEIKQAVRAHEEIVRSYKGLKDEKFQIYVETGDLSQLSLTAEEFENVKNSHNELVEQLKLPTDLMITFNNHEHIMSKLEEFEKKYREIRAMARDEEIDAFHTLGKDIKEADPIWSNEYNDNAGARRKAKKEIDRLKRQAANAPENSPEKLAFENQIIPLEASIENYTNNMQAEFKRHMQDYRDRDDEVERQRGENRNANYKFKNNLQEAYTDSGAQGVFDGLLGDNERLGLLLAVDQFTKQRKKIDALDETTERATGTYKKFTDGQIDAANGAKEFSKELDNLESIVNSKAYKDWAGKNGVTSETDLSTWLFDEKNAKEAERFFNNVLPNAVKQSKTHFNELRGVIKDFATDFGLGQDEAENFFELFDKDRSKWIKQAFDIDSDAAYRYLNMREDTYAIGRHAAAMSDVSEGEWFSNIHRQIGQLSDISPEVAVRFKVQMDENGNFNWDKVLRDMAPLLDVVDKELLVKVGFIQADGDFNPKLFYSELEKITQSEYAAKVGIKVDERGNVDIQEFVNNLNAGNVTITPVIDPVSGEIVGSQIKQLVQQEDGTLEWEVVIDTSIQNPDEPQKKIDDAVGKTKGKKYESTIDVDYKVNPNIVVSTGNNDYNLQNYWDVSIQGILGELTSRELTEEQIVIIKSKFIPDGESVDLSAVASHIQALIENQDPEAVELIQKVRAHFELSDEESINIEQITQYLADMLASGEHTESQELKIIVDLLAEFVRNESVSDEAQEAGEEVVEEAEQALSSNDYQVRNVVKVNTEFKQAEEINTNLMERLGLDHLDTEVQLVVTTLINGMNELETATQHAERFRALEDYVEKNMDVNVDYSDTLTAEEQIAALISAVEAAHGKEAVLKMLAEVFGLGEVETAETKLNELDGKNSSSTNTITTEGEEELSTVVSDLNAIDGFKAMADLAVNTENAVENIANIKSGMEQLSTVEDVSLTVTAEDNASDVLTTAAENASTIDGTEVTIKINGDPTDYDSDSAATKADLIVLDSSEAVPDIKADKTDFDTKKAQTQADLTALDASTGTPKINGDKSGWDTAVGDVRNSVASLNTTTATVMISADASPFWGVYNSLSNLSKTISVNISASVSKKSTTIGNTIGRALSQSIGAGVSKTIGKSASSAINKMSSAATEATVNSDVWRHWSRELYRGLPLETALDELSNQLKLANGNEERMVQLYRQQIDLLKKQIELEKQNKVAKQAELADVLTKLKGHGFKTDGNKITNLEHSKTFSGDLASEIDKMLSDWKKLYESLDAIDKKISENITKVSEAEQDSELKGIEQSLKRTEALLTAVKNNTELQKVKLDMFDDSDFEMGIALRLEGLKDSQNGIGRLLAEYNRLSNTYVAFSENGEKVLSQLEDLKDQIIDNADAILEYRDAINDLQVERLSKDYDKFTDSIERNLDMLGANIDALQDGLLNGESLSDRATSRFGKLQFGSDTEFDKAQRARIKLEDDLNTALEYYAKANIDRTAYVARTQLNIETNKYNELLKMAQEFSNGKVYSGTLSFTDTALNNIEKFAKSQNEAYRQWQASVARLHNQYTAQYQQLTSDYDSLANTFTGMTDRVRLNNEFVIKQLSLQESMYRDIIKANETAINQAREQLANDTLRTEQREELLELITKYEDSSIEAEENIRKTIKDRYDFQFSLIDKEMTRVAKYATDMDYLLNVAKLVTNSTKAITPLYEAIYGTKVNQYGKIKDELAKLVKEQDKFAKGTLEWNLLDEKINDVTESMRDLTLETLNANGDILKNNVETIREAFQKGMFDGKTLDRWKEFRELWVQGITKELTLEDFRKRLLDIEDETISKRLEMLDRQDKISQRDVDYIDKQMKVLELRQKLTNLEGERTVQELVRGDDGKWAFAYSVDKTEYDKTKKELDTATKDLDKFKEDQRVRYTEAINAILNRAENGEFTSAEDLANEINMVNSAYGLLAEDDPTLSLLSVADLIDKYKNYLLNNGMVVGDIIDPTGTTTSPLIDTIGAQLESSFINISYDLGRIIGDEIRKALLNIKDEGLSGGVYNIGSLEFPNVTDPTGFQEVLLGLQAAAKMKVLRKS